MSALTVDAPAGGKTPVASPAPLTAEVLDDWFAKRMAGASVGGVLLPGPRSSAGAYRFSPEKEEKTKPASMARLADESVPSKEKDERKQPVRRLLAPAMRSGARGGRMAKGRRDLAMARLVLNYSVTSSATSPMAPVLGVIPSSVAEWTYWKELYDEVRVTGIHVDYRLNTSTGTATQAWIVCAYDPIDLTPLTGITQGCVFKHHLLTVQPSTTLGSVPIGFTPRGVWHLDASVHTDNARSVSVSAAAGGWMAVVDAADAWGYLKWYVEALSVGTSNIVAIVTFDCSFRNRQ